MEDISNFKTKLVYQFNMLCSNVFFAYRKFFFHRNVSKQNNLQFKQEYIKYVAWTTLCSILSKHEFHWNFCKLWPIYCLSYQLWRLLQKIGSVLLFHEMKVRKVYLEFLHYHCIQRVSLAKLQMFFILLLANTKWNPPMYVFDFPVS